MIITALRAPGLGQEAIHTDNLSKLMGLQGVWDGGRAEAGRGSERNQTQVEAVRQKKLENHNLTQRWKARAKKWKAREVKTPAWSHTEVRLVPSEFSCFFTRIADLHSCEVSHHGVGVGIGDLR